MIDVEAIVVLASEISSSRPDEVDTKGKNKSQSQSSILSGRPPSQKPRVLKCQKPGAEEKD